MSATDKELLELAAKAAGYEIVGDADSMVVQHNRGMGAFVVRNDRGGDSIWNPLTDDGDALRLAVKLNMVIDTDFNGGACAGNADIDFSEPEYGYQEGKGKKEPYAATRRAIVRAAAEIGSNMK